MIIHLANQAIDQHQLESLRESMFIEIKAKKDLVSAIYARLKYAGKEIAI